MDYKDKKILVTGGTGSLGQVLTRKLLNSGAKRIVIFSRDEVKQSIMERDFNYNKTLRFFLGDIKDLERLKRAFGGGIDYVFHLATFKQIHKGEYDPLEFLKTNVMGTQNVIDASIEKRVKKLLFTSTDKATLAHTMYGRTKALAEGLVTNANFYQRKTACSSVRYGNIFGSRFSLIEIWEDMLKQGKKLPITDPRMKRFHMTLEESAGFVLKAMQLAQGGEIFIPRLKVYLLKDFADAFLNLHNLNSDDLEVIGIRGAERIYEILISQDEMPNTYEVDDIYAIIPSPHLRERFRLEYSYDRKAEIDSYTSNNVELLTEEELKELILGYENMLASKHIP